MVVMETVEGGTDGEDNVWGAECSAGPHLSRETLNVATWLQTPVQH